jgi:hypothetical protein
VAAEHRIGVGLGGDRRARNRYHEPLSAGNLRACDELPRRVGASPRHAVRSAYAFLDKSWPMQQLRCSSSIRAIPEDRGQQCSQGQQRCTRATVTLLVLLLGLGLTTGWPAGALRAPTWVPPHSRLQWGRKPQQPVISPAKKVRPGRCGAATLDLRPQKHQSCRISGQTSQAYAGWVARCRLRWSSSACNRR